MVYVHFLYHALLLTFMDHFWKHFQNRDEVTVMQADSSARGFPIDTSEGEQLRFPPSDVRLTPLTALCLPFSGFALRPKGHTPLEPPIDFLHKSIKIHLFLGSLSSSRNHARSPPDDFLFSLPDCF